MCVDKNLETEEVYICPSLNKCLRWKHKNTKYPCLMENNIEKYL